MSVALSPLPNIPRVVRSPDAAFGRYKRPKKPPTKRVAIVGFCQSTRELTPYDDGTFEIWGLNKGSIFMPIAHRWFEMHGPDVYRWEIRRPQKHVEWLRGFNGPVYLHEADPDLPNSITFPLEDVAADVGINSFRLLADGSEQPLTERPYLSASIAYEIALAIHERFREIHMYGIDLNTNAEYAWQKPCVEWLLGVAAGRGIKVIVPEDCALLKGKLYGRGFMTAGGDKHARSQYEQRMQHVQQELGQESARCNQLMGAQQVLTELMADAPPGINAEKLHNRLKEINGGLQQSVARANQLQGSLAEVQYWISMTAEGQDGAEALAQLRAERDGSPNGEAVPVAALAALVEGG